MITDNQFINLVLIITSDIVIEDCQKWIGLRLIGTYMICLKTVFLSFWPEKSSDFCAKPTQFFQDSRNILCEKNSIVVTFQN